MQEWLSKSMYMRPTYFILRGYRILPGLASCRLGLAVYMEIMGELISGYAEQVWLLAVIIPRDVHLSVYMEIMGELISGYAGQVWLLAVIIPRDVHLSVYMEIMGELISGYAEQVWLLAVIMPRDVHLSVVLPVRKTSVTSSTISR